MDGYGFMMYGWMDGWTRGIGGDGDCCYVCTCSVYLLRFRILELVSLSIDGYSIGNWRYRTYCFGNIVRGNGGKIGTDVVCTILCLIL